MCLYPKLILNRKYLPNKKNNGIPHPITDERTKLVPVGCGKCMECRKKKKNEWNVRLLEEVRDDNKGKFITLSFSEEELSYLEQEIQYEDETIEGYDLENKCAKLAIRRFLERWRAETGKSVKHWFVTELGQTKTERIHLHGILWTDDLRTLQKAWKYGRVWVGLYCTERTVNYMVKYISKTDKLHEEYKPIILTSPGVGSGYMKHPNANNNRFKGEKTTETYRTRQGFKKALPIYYRNKIYTEQEREQLWINKLNKQVRYINGVKIDVSKGEETYFKALEYHRQINRTLGYGNDTKNWDRIKYEKKLRLTKQRERLEKTINTKKKSVYKGRIINKIIKDEILKLSDNGTESQNCVNHSLRGEDIINIINNIDMDKYWMQSNQNN